MAARKVSARERDEKALPGYARRGNGQPGETLMCGRFNMTADPLTRLFMRLVGQPFPGPDRLNVAPTETVPVVATEAGAGTRRIAEMRWWLVPHWAKEPSTRYAMFNARAEGLARSRAFRDPFARRRCLVPVSGFYEWLREDGRKVPYLVTADADDGLLLAGLWDRWQGDDASLETFTVVTTAAAPDLRWLHDRQPVILGPAGAETWLDPAARADALLDCTAAGLPVAIAVTAVDPRVNNARFKEAACTVAAGPVRHFGPSSPSARKADSSSI